jgi:hypothetical protein
MITMGTQVGRLLEIRLSGMVTLEEVQDFVQRSEKNPHLLPRPYLICTDVRKVKWLSPQFADMISNIMSQHNDVVERQAIIIDEGNAVGIMQLKRIIRDAGSSARRHFFDEQEMIDWLGEVMNKKEKLRLIDFLVEGRSV